jgi:hypothetical protein
MFHCVTAFHLPITDLSVSDRCWLLCGFKLGEHDPYCHYLS